MYRLGILVSGRGSNMQKIIEACENGKIDAQVVIVISNNFDALALEKAHQKNIEVMHLNAEEAMVDCLQKRKVDLVCLAGFMKIIKQTMLQAYPNRILNIHPSLLPKFPGLNTHQRVLDVGESESGCTVHYVDKVVDRGAIILQATVPVLPEDTSSTLADRVLKEEHRIYPEAIQMIINGSL